jgi:hypothetical protein
MQVRRITLVVCLLVGMAAGATGTVPHRAHRGGKMDDGILATILDALGISLDGQLSVPPG